MTVRAYAAWVEPIAARLAATPAEIDRLVSDVATHVWEEASEYPAWSYKDHLSHIAASHEGVHDVIRSVIAGEKPEMSRFDRINETNEEQRQARRARSIEQLAADAKQASEQTLDLLTEVAAEREAFEMGPFTFGMALQGFSYHDVEHLNQMRDALQ
jgi:hypothetical protein